MTLRESIPYWQSLQKKSSADGSHLSWWRCHEKFGQGVHHVHTQICKHADNNRIINDTIQVLWIKNSDQKEYEQQITAALAGLIGISPKDELEGMMAAQLIASRSDGMLSTRDDRGANV
jgi:hypothetical protein